MPWILLLLISLFSAPSLAVAIPGVTTGTTASQQSTPPPEPDVEQKKAAYGALADVVQTPRFSTACGLLLEAQAQRKRGLKVREARDVKQLFGRMKSWLEKNF